MEQDRQELWKRWKVCETLLKRAHSALPNPEAKEEQQFRALEKAFLEYIEHNEIELALNKLEEMGEIVTARGGFWKDLIRVAETMGLSDRIPHFENKFLQTPPRLRPD